LIRCGIERIYVHESLFDAFVAKAVEIVNGYKLGNPLESETTLGPMAHVRFADEVRAQTMEAIEAGATAHIDPADFPQDNGAYLMPQILTNVTHDMRVMLEESFGPVVGIMPVKSDAQAIELMNDSDFGLTASLWTQDVARAEAIADQIETGTVFMNRADYLDPQPHTSQIIPPQKGLNSCPSPPIGLTPQPSVSVLAVSLKSRMLALRQASKSPS